MRSRFSPTPEAQGSLLAPIAEIHRLFFAVMPDAAAIERIAATAVALEFEHGLRGRRVTPERYHATLHFLGDNVELRGDLVDAAIGAALKVRMPPFAMTMDRACTFARAVERGSSPGVLRDSAVESAAHPLWRSLGLALAEKGFGRELEHSFVPHVTLLYQDGNMLPDVSIAPIDWHVREFVLVHSTFGKADYEILGRWPLDGDRRALS